MPYKPCFLCFCAVLAACLPLQAGLITIIASSLSATEGVSFSGLVGTFYDSNPGLPVSNYTATVNWGDGTANLAAIAALGGFTLTAGHTYAEEGTYSFELTVLSLGEPSTAFNTATVADAPLTFLTSSAVTAQAGVPVTPALGTFSDGNPLAPVTDFTGTVNWGDGTVSAATIAALSSGFQVSGAHTYATSGIYGIVVNALDEGGSTVSFETTATVSDTQTPEPGTFALLLAAVAPGWWLRRARRHAG